MSELKWLILNDLNKKGIVPIVIGEANCTNNGGFDFANFVYGIINAPGNIPEAILYVNEDFSKVAVNSRWRKTIEGIFKKLCVKVTLTSFGRGSETQNENR